MSERNPKPEHAVYFDKLEFDDQAEKVAYDRTIENILRSLGSGVAMRLALLDPELAGCMDNFGLTDEQCRMLVRFEDNRDLLGGTVMSAFYKHFGAKNAKNSYELSEVSSVLITQDRENRLDIRIHQYEYDGTLTLDDRVFTFDADNKVYVIASAPAIDYHAMPVDFQVVVAPSANQVFRLNEVVNENGSIVRHELQPATPEDCNRMMNIMELVSK